MENYTEIELSFYSISFLLLTFIVVLYASFPAKFLKHPSQLYFYSLIFQVIYTVLFIALDILILRYFLFRNSLELMQAVYMLYLASFVFIMFYHYLLALNIEIILKILRTSSQGYKKRVFFYHFASIAMTIIIFTLALSATNFKFVVDDGNFKHGFVYNFIVWYIATISLTTWVCTAIYFKYMIKSRSTGLLNLVLLTIGINITVALGFLLPQTLYYFKVSDSLNMTGISWFITVINASAGIFEFVILVLNKKCIRFIVGIFRQQKNRFLSKERRSQSFIPVELRSDSQLLVEINSSQQNLDDGLLSDFFNNVTKQALIQLFIVLTLRFMKKKKTKKDKKKHFFSFADLEALYERINILFIKEIPIANLVITEYFPEYFEKLKEVYTDTVILNTLLSPYNYQKLINLIQETGGRSQAFLFLTSDHNFMLKTITKTERKYFINKMFPKYFERLKTDESKLVRILGVFKINSLKQSVVIMENILITKEKCVIFDLKGSRLSRLVKGIEDPESPQTGIVLKDENFLLFNKKLRLSQENKSKLIEALITDFNVLKECEVIDYSLLLGIYPKNFKQIKERNLMVDENGTKFSLGIIDIFQEYNFLKASEKKIKTILYKKEDISVATPLDYFERISEFILNIFE